jgi:TetR/AcrR family transcriptional repressor of nem operon
VPYPAERSARTKDKIVHSARALFNRYGFDRVSIDQIMAGAGLTRGAFYTYFGSKSDLYADTLGCFLTDASSKVTWKGVHVDLEADDAGIQIIRAYLSRQHLEAREEACPMVALPTDVARANIRAKRAFEHVFQTMVTRLESGLNSNRHPRRATAQAIAALCVGSMIIARASSDPAAAADLCDASLRIALELGGWTA